MEVATDNVWVHLPVEILQQVFEYINDADFISLILASPQLYESLVDIKRRLCFGTCYSLKTAHLQRYLDCCLLPPNVVCIDFTDCYWIPSSQIVECAAKTALLEEIYVTGTCLKAADITQLLAHCSSLKRLGLTILGEDNTFWKSVSPSIDDDDELISLLSCFTDFGKSLSNLSHLIIHGDCYSYVQVAVFISFCSALEELSIEIATTKQPSFAESIEMGSLLRRIPELPKSCRKVRKFSCLMNDTTRGGPFFNLVKCMRAWRNPNIQCFWVPDFPLYHLRTLELPDSELVALQGSDLTCLHVCNYSIIQYLSVDCSMGHLVYQFLDLQLLSCVFETQEVFYAFCENHPNIHSLQLKYNKEFSQGIFNGIGFHLLPKLKKFSVDTSLLQDGVQDEAVFHEEAIDELSRHCKHLVELEFRQTKFTVQFSDKILQQLEKLEKLTVVGNLEVPLEGLWSLKCLKVLRLGSAPSLIASSLGKFESHFPVLQHLKFGCNGYQQLVRTVSALKHCASLQRLSLLRVPGNAGFPATDNEPGTQLQEMALGLCKLLPHLIFVYVQFDIESDISSEVDEIKHQKPALWAFIGPKPHRSMPRVHARDMVEVYDSFLATPC